MVTHALIHPFTGEIASYLAVLSLSFLSVIGTSLILVGSDLLFLYALFEFCVCIYILNGSLLKRTCVLTGGSCPVTARKKNSSASFGS